MATPIDLILQSGVGSDSAGGALTLLPGISEGTDKVGANLTLNGGQGTGTGTGGSIIFKVADGGTGSSANTNTLQTALEIKDNGEIVSSGSHYIASAANASWGGLEVSPTLTFTGNTSVTNASPINMVSLSAPTLSCGSAMNVDTAASLYVAGAPSTGGSLTISNSYSLFVDAGATRLDGDVSLGNDLSLTSDSAVLSFGANSEIKLTHVHDEGLALKHTATGDDKPIKLTLQTGETDIALNDKIGVIDFQAPDEGTGTNAILVCAGIEAVSEGDFAADNNATKLSFKTAASETASEKMKLSSAGVLTVNNTIESGVSSSTTGSLKLYCSGNDNTTTISSANNNVASVNYVLPDNAPTTTNQYFLTSDTSGNMSWATNALGGGGGGGGGTTNIYDITDNVNAGGATGLVIDGSGGPSFTATNSNTLYNVGLGYSLFKTNTTGGYNTLMGYNVGTSIGAGSSNTLIGSGAGGSIATGNNNTCLGYNASVSASGVNNEITLGNNAITDLRCADTTIASLSDSRDKTDIIDLPWGLDFIDSLRPVQFTWDRRVLTPDDENWPMNGKKRAGFIAQDLQSAMTDNANEVLDLVYTSNPERLEVKQGKLVPILTQAIKELKAELDTLKAEVAALKNASN